MLSGTLPFRHGVVDDGTTLGPSVPLLAPLLKSRGYATAGVVSGFYVSSRFGFERGFDRFEDFGLPGEARARDSVRASEVTDRAVAELAAAGDRPFFLFVHYFDCHNNYDPPAPYNRAFDEDATVVPYANYEYYKTHPLPAGTLPHILAQYDEEILYTDAQIGRLLKALDERSRTGDTYVIVTSDHGEEFFEHGSWGHGNSLHSQVLRVPLIAAGPGIPGGGVRSELVRHEDLAPTLLELLSLPPSPRFQGASYAALLKSGVPAGGRSGRGQERGIAEPAGAGAESAGSAGGRFVLTETSRFKSNQVGAVAGGQELIVDIAGERAELYDVEKDPEEKNDLAPARPAEVARAFAPLARAILEAIPDRWVVSWSGGASGGASIEGLLLPARVPEPEAGERLPFGRLKRWQPAAPSGEVRLAAIPPDAPIEFVARCGAADPRCATVAGAPAIPSPTSAGGGAPAKQEAGVVRFRVDPVADGARLRTARA